MVDPGAVALERFEARARVLGALQRHGWNATSFQVLEAGFSYWFEPSGDGCVAYVDTGRAWVAAGAPLAPEDRLGQVAGGFVRAAARAGRRACFFATERRFVERVELEHLLIGEQPVWDPRVWSESLRRAPSLREQLRRARAKGVRVRRVEPAEYADGSAPLRRSMDKLIARWQSTKAMPPMGFLVHVAPFEFAGERQLFVAELGAGPEPLVGFAAVVPIYARQGWFVEDLIRAPRAPNGTTELLVDAAMRTAAERGSAYFTLGLAPLAGEVSASLSLMRRYAAPLYDFGGLRAFKAKFRPQRWAPIYLSHPSELPPVGAVYESLRAFARRGLLRYGLETLLRGPAVVLRALSLALVPWTALLASLDAERWFPAAGVKWAWVGFDLALCLALLVASQRFRPQLSRAIVGAVGVDVCLTLAQASLFNVPRVATVSDALGVMLAVLAPAVAFPILVNAHRRACRVHGY